MKKHQIIPTILSAIMLTASVFSCYLTADAAESEKEILFQEEMETEQEAVANEMEIRDSNRNEIPDDTGLSEETENSDDIGSEDTGSEEILPNDDAETELKQEESQDTLSQAEGHSENDVLVNESNSEEQEYTVELEMFNEISENYTYSVSGNEATITGNTE